MISDKRIDKWFKEKQKMDGFWEFIFEEDVFDLVTGAGSNEQLDDMVREGYELAKRAGDKPVHMCMIADYTLFYIGTVEEILARLSSEWENWVIKNCTVPTTETQTKRDKVAAMKLEAEQAVKQAKDKLKAVKDLAKNLK